MQIVQVTLQRFEESLASTEGALKAAQAESKALAKQQQDMEKDIRAAKDDILAGFFRQQMPINCLCVPSDVFTGFLHFVRIPHIPFSPKDLCSFVGTLNNNFNKKTQGRHRHCRYAMPAAFNSFT